MINKWKTISSEMLISDQWLKLRSDKCRRDDGTVIEPYYVIDYPDWVCILAVTGGLDVILTKEYRHAAGVIGIGLPGGRIETIDEDVEAAAQRELVEETGYVCKEIVSIGSLFANWAHQTNRVHYFLGLNAEKSGVPQLDPTEEIEVMLVPLGELLSSQILQQSFHLACLQLAQSHLRRLGFNETALSHAASATSRSV